MAGLMARPAGDDAAVAVAGESDVMGAESGSCSGSRVGCKEAHDTRATTGAWLQGRVNRVSLVNSSSLIHSRGEAVTLTKKLEYAFANRDGVARQDSEIATVSAGQPFRIHPNDFVSVRI